MRAWLCRMGFAKLDQIGLFLLSVPPSLITWDWCLAVNSVSHSWGECFESLTWFFNLVHLQMKNYLTYIYNIWCAFSMTYGIRTVYEVCEDGTSFRWLTTPDSKSMATISSSKGKRKAGFLGGLNSDGLIACHTPDPDQLKFLKSWACSTATRRVQGLRQQWLPLSPSLTLPWAIDQDQG